MPDRRAAQRERLARSGWRFRPVAPGQDEGCAFALLGADGAEDISGGGSLVFGRARTCSALGPTAGDLVLLADARPHPELVEGRGEPDLYGVGSDALLAPDLFQARGKTFLNPQSRPRPERDGEGGPRACDNPSCAARGLTSARRRRHGIPRRSIGGDRRSASGTQPADKSLINRRIVLRSQLCAAPALLAADGHPAERALNRAGRNHESLV